MRYLIIGALFFNLVILSTSGYSQIRSTLSGRIIDSESKFGVPFVTIKLSNVMRGVISNASGDFQIPDIYKAQFDSLVISCIGYHTKIVPLSTMDGEKINIIELKVSITALSEVVIRGKKATRQSARQIIKKAIVNISSNYPQMPFSYEAYYRDYQLKDSAYVNLNEAIIEVLDDGFDTYDLETSRIKLLEYKLNHDFPRDEATEIFYDNKGKKFIPGAQIQANGGNELTILRIHDAIRNFEYPSYSFLYKLEDNFLENHFFKLKNPVYIDNLYLNNIEFQTVDNIDGTGHYARGRILIQADNYAIHKLEYTVYRKERKEDVFLFDVQVEYSKHNSLMYLNYISFNNIFRVNNPQDFAIVNMSFDKNEETFMVEFNNQPKASSIADNSNYKIKIDGKNIDIKKAEIQTQNSNIVHFVLDIQDSIAFYLSDKPLTERLKFEHRDIIDTNGRKLGKASYMDVNQFRELFVQKQNTGQTTNNDTLFIDKLKPLINNSFPEGRANPSYWMNTPLIKISN